MNIVLLSSILPSPPGEPGSPRTFCFARHLSQRHTVSLLLCSARAGGSERLATLKRSGVFAQIEVLPPAPAPTSVRKWIHRFKNGPGAMYRYRCPKHVERMQSLVSSYISRLGADMIYVDGIEATQYVPAKTPAVVDLCDALSLLFERQAGQERNPWNRFRLRMEARAYREWEREVAERFPAIVMISDVDQQHLCALAPAAHPEVIGNGVDEEYFISPEALDREKREREKIVLFVGVLDYPPNDDAVTFAYQSIFPLIRRKVAPAQLVVVGKNPSAELRKLADTGEMRLHPNVPDVRPYIEKAALFLCPLRYGAGMKNKVLIAMASGVPVVGTRIAFEGLHVTPGRECLVADTAEELAAHAALLLADPERARAVGEAGFAYVRNNHSWTESGDRLERLFLQQIDPQRG